MLYLVVLSAAIQGEIHPREGTLTASRAHPAQWQGWAGWEAATSASQRDGRGVFSSGSCATSALNPHGSLPRACAWAQAITQTPKCGSASCHAARGGVVPPWAPRPCLPWASGAGGVRVLTSFLALATAEFAVASRWEGSRALLAEAVAQHHACAGQLILRLKRK